MNTFLCLWLTLNLSSYFRYKIIYNSKTSLQETALHVSHFMNNGHAANDAVHFRNILYTLMGVSLCVFVSICLFTECCVLPLRHKVC